MELLWPGSLYLLALIPLIVAVYVLVLRRRRRFAVRYSSLSLVRAALPKYSRWRRHLPFALFLLALAALSLAMTRPMTLVTVPSKQATIILAIDVSRSMCSNDIEPTRLEAAKASALNFVKNQEASTQIGVVAFAGFAELIQAPTNDKEMLRAAIQSLNTARRTAIGSGIVKSIDAIAEFDPKVPPLTIDGSTAPAPRAPGDYVPNIIVLLTDGRSNSGPEPLDAAQFAVDRGIRVYTIGFGTNDPGDMRNCSPFTGGGTYGFTDQFGGGGGGGGGFNRGIDEVTLQQIAKETGGEYYSATSADELQDVFKKLPTYLITTKEFMEVSVFLVAIGAFFAFLAITLAMIWNPIG